MAERSYKEIRHKSAIENGIICNCDLVIPPQIQRKLCTHVKRCKEITSFMKSKPYTGLKEIMCTLMEWNCY